MGAINILLGSGSLNHYGLNRVFELARRLDFDGVELMVDNTADSRQPEYLQRLQEDFFMPVPVLHAPFAWTSYPAPPADWFERIGLARAIGRAIGSTILVAHPPLCREPIIDFTDPEWAGDLPVAFELMPRRSHRIFGKRCHWWRKHIWRAEHPRAWAGLPRIVFDTSHVGAWGNDLVGETDRLVKQISHIHISNMQNGTEHLAPGTGELPLKDFLRHLVRRNYRGSVTIELAPHSTGLYSWEEAQQVISESLNFCRRAIVEAFTRRAARPHRSRRPRRR